MHRRIAIKISRSGLASFYPLLQEGIRLSVRGGSSVLDFLVSGIGLDHEEIEDKIRSVLINGHPVDDPGSTILKEGDRLALSASMPGLVGSTLIKGSPLAQLRSAITYTVDKGGTKEEGEVFIEVRLFNLVMKDLAEGFLQRGVVLSGERLRGILMALISSQNLKGISLQERDVTFQEISQYLDRDEELLLKVQVLG